MIVAILGVSPVQAAYYMMFVSLAALVGRLLVAYLSERFGRRLTGVVVSFGATAAIVITGYAGDRTIEKIDAELSGPLTATRRA